MASAGVQDLVGKVKQIPDKINIAMEQQHLGLQVAYQTLLGSSSGGVLGFFMGTLMSQAQQTQPTNNMNPQQQDSFQKMQMSLGQAGGRWAQAKNFAVITGTQQGLSFLFKKLRGKEDFEGVCMSAFGSGCAYGLASGQGQPILLGMAFALFQGIFYKIGAALPGMGKGQQEEDYLQGTYVCQLLGQGKYARKLKNQQLTDRTIMLWNDSALKDAGIPAGPRLMILHHLDQVKKQFPNQTINDILSPNIPLKQ